MDQCDIIRKQYKEYLRGKRVVVVGPAPTIINTKQREHIDSYDVVVRLNKALPIPQNLVDDIGIRTDVLYNCMNPSPECGDKISIPILEENGIKFLVAPYPPTKGYRFGQDINNYLKKVDSHRIPFCYFDQNYFKELLEKIKLPNTGISAILDLLSCDINELYITGFTFFKGGYIKEYRDYGEQEVLRRMACFDLHDQNKQLEYMKKILPNDPRVIMDAALTEIINQQSVSFEIHEHVYKHEHEQEHVHGYKHEQGHVHGYKHEHEQEHVHGYKHEHEQEHVHGYRHEHEQEHVHGYRHEQEHVHGYKHEHEHEHDQKKCNRLKFNKSIKPINSIESIKFKQNALKHKQSIQQNQVHKLNINHKKTLIPRKIRKSMQTLGLITQELCAQERAGPDQCAIGQGAKSLIILHKKSPTPKGSEKVKNLRSTKK